MSEKIKNIVITGPECTGKSLLSADLAKYYNTIYIPEYARTYIENLDRPYEYADLEIIGRKQLEELEFYKSKANKLLFIDTYLIITKVWFEVVYKKYPEWINEKLIHSKIDLFLVCNTDIPWESDNVRENGGDMREKLLKIYISEIEKFNFKYEIISGTGHKRLDSAINAIKKHFL